MNAALISGLATPYRIAVSGSDLFVTNAGNDTIGEYTTSGTTVNASLISESGGPFGIAVSGSNLFVANAGNDTIGEYTTSGATVNASLISGLSNPFGIAIGPTTVSAPEPPTSLMLGAGLLGLLGLSAVTWCMKRLV